MSRFYFDFQDGGPLSPDEEGIEFATVQDAHAEAVRALLEIATAAASTDADGDFVMIVRGESGETVLTVSLSLKCSWPAETQAQEAYRPPA